MIQEKRFILVRQGAYNPSKFSKVVIHDKTRMMPTVINGFPTKIYMPISPVMDYLDAYHIMKRMNEMEQELRDLAISIG